MTIKFISGFSVIAKARLLQRNLPNARIEVIAGATHDLEIDHPDVIAPMIEAHLSAP